MDGDPDGWCGDGDDTETSSGDRDGDGDDSRGDGRGWVQISVPMQLTIVLAALAEGISHVGTCRLKFTNSLIHLTDLSPKFHTRPFLFNFSFLNLVISCVCQLSIKNSDDEVKKSAILTRLLSRPVSPSCRCHFEYQQFVYNLKQTRDAPMMFFPNLIGPVRFVQLC